MKRNYDNSENLIDTLACYSEKGLFTYDRLLKSEDDFENWWTVCATLANTKRNLIRYNDMYKTLCYLTGNDCDDIILDATIKIATHYDDIMKTFMNIDSIESLVKAKIMNGYVHRIIRNMLSDMFRKVSHEDDNDRRVPNFHNIISLDKTFQDSDVNLYETLIDVPLYTEFFSILDNYILKEDLLDAIQCINAPVKKYCFLSVLLGYTPKELCLLEEEYGRAKVFNRLIAELSNLLNDEIYADTYFNAFSEEDFEYSGAMSSQQMIRHYRNDAVEKVARRR